MKKSIIFGLLLAASALSATEPFLLRSKRISSNERHTTPPAPSLARKKNFNDISNIVVKLNASQLVFKNISLMGEYGFHPKFSAGLGFSSLLERSLPGLIFEQTAFFDVPTFKGWAVTPEIRWYPAGSDEKPAPRGFYLAGYLRYAKYTFSQGARYQETATSPIFEGLGTMIYKGANGGLMIGYQWIAKSGFSFDLWILGGGYGTASFEYSWFSDQANLSVAQQADLEGNYTEVFNTVSVLGTGPVVVTTTPKSATAKLTGLPMQSFRGLGLCFGYAF